METTKVIILKNCSRDGIKYRGKKVYELSVDIAGILKSEGYAIEAEDYFGIESVQGVEDRFRSIETTVNSTVQEYTDSEIQINFPGVQETVDNHTDLINDILTRLAALENKG